MHFLSKRRSCHMSPKRKAAVDILAALANTPLAFVIDCLLKGEFAPAPEKPVVEGEEVIGELTSLEKAILTAASKIAESNNLMAKEVKDKGEEPDMSIFKQNKTNYNALDKLMWACIRHRLGAQAYESVGLAIRADFKIIHYAPKNTSGSILGMFMGDPWMNMAADIMAAMAGEGGKKRFCNSCPLYEECDSPEKEPRI